MAQSYFQGPYREALKTCRDDLLIEYSIRANVEHLITDMVSKGHITYDQMTSIDATKRTRDKMAMVLSILENSSNVAQAFVDLIDQMRTDERRFDIPDKLMKTLKVINREYDWHYVETIRKSMIFLVENLQIEAKVDGIVLHMVSKEHINITEQQDIFETPSVYEKVKMLFGYLMQPARVNKESAFNDLIEHLSEDNARLDIPQKLTDSLKEITEMTSKHEEKLYGILTRLDIPYMADGDGSTQLERDHKPSQLQEDLLQACVDDNHGTFQSVLKVSNDTNMVNSYNEQLQTPFILTCKYARGNFVQALINNENVEVNRQDIHGRTAFVYSIMRGDTDIISLLLNCKRVNINIRDGCGLTFVWYLFEENVVNALSATLKNVSDGLEIQTVVTILKENSSNLNWGKICNVVTVLVECNRVYHVDLLKAMILAGSVSMVKLILDASDGKISNTDIENIILNGISAENADIFKLLVDSPHISLDKFNDWSVNKLLKYTIEHCRCPLISAQMLKLVPEEMKVDEALRVVVSIKSICDGALPVILTGYNMEQFNVRDADENTVFMLLCRYESTALVSQLLDYPEIDFTAVNRYHQTAFMLSLKNQSEDVARLLKEHSGSIVDVNQADKNGVTPLMAECEDANESGVRLLLSDSRVDVNASDQIYGDTAIMYACRTGVSSGIVDRINNGRTFSYQPLVSIDNSRIVKLLINNTNVDVNAQSRTGFTALQYACMSGKLKTANALLQVDTIDINTHNIFGLTPLSQVPMYGCDGTVLHLERHRDMIPQDSGYGQVWSGFSSDDRMLRMVMGVSDRKVNEDRYVPPPSPNSTNDNVASFPKDLDDEFEILTPESDVLHNRANNGSTQNHDDSCDGGYVNIISTSLSCYVSASGRHEMDSVMGGESSGRGYVNSETSRSDGNIATITAIPVPRPRQRDMPNRTRRDNIETPVGSYDGDVTDAEQSSDDAAYSKDTMSSSMPIIQGDMCETETVIVSPKNHIDTCFTTSLPLCRKKKNTNKNKKALLEACGSGKAKIVARLLRRSDIKVNYGNTMNQTPLVRACLNGHDGIVRMLLACKGVHVNMGDSRGWTPLIVACRNGHGAIVAMLLGRTEIDVNQADGQGYTPLIWACNRGQENVVSMLLVKDGVFVDVADKKGQTALMMASIAGMHKIVKILLGRKDIRVAIKDNTGLQAIDHAIDRGYGKVVELLTQRQYT